MNKNVKIIVIFIILALTLFTFSVKIYGRTDMTINPGDFDPGDIPKEEVKEIMDKASVIITAIRAVGAAVTVIVLLVLGIKFMTASVSERAQYKNSIIPYLIGVAIFFSVSQGIGMIMTITRDVFK